VVLPEPRAPRRLGTVTAVMIDRWRALSRTPRARRPPAGPACRPGRPRPMTSSSRRPPFAGPPRRTRADRSPPNHVRGAPHAPPSPDPQPRTGRPSRPAGRRPPRAAAFPAAPRPL